MLGSADGEKFSGNVLGKTSCRRTFGDLKNELGKARGKIITDFREKKCEKV